MTKLLLPLQVIRFNIDDETEGAAIVDSAGYELTAMDVSLIEEMVSRANATYNLMSTELDPVPDVESSIDDWSVSGWSVNLDGGGSSRNPH